MMNKPTRLLSALLALSLASASVFAQYDRRGDDRRGDGRRNDRDRGEQRYDNNRWDNNRYDNRWSERGAGPDRGFHRGDRLPREYRTYHYVVDDWRGHRLSAPPRGYHWVQYGGDYLLVAIATGVIVNALINN